MTDRQFSDRQLQNWKAYEAVRRSGVTNMFDVERARKLARLTEADYRFCMRNFGELKHEAAGLK